MEKNSECQLGFMHEFELMEEYPEGVLEVCSKCRKAKYFPHNIPNLVYLSYHLRSGLQKWNPRFYKEYER